MSKLDRERLEPFANLLAEMYELVRAASDVELTQLARAVESTTETNCWWATHRVAQIILPVIKEEQADRQRTAERAMAEQARLEQSR